MYRIVVVEDSKPILRDLVNQIHNFNNDTLIKTAPDGESALRLLQSFKPEVLISDIKLPMLDGLALIQRAKLLYPSLRCFIVSGYSDFEFTHEAMMLHVDEYILKPVDPEAFRRILRDVFCEVDRINRERREAYLSALIAHREEPGGVTLPEHYVLYVLQNGIVPKLSEELVREEIHASLWAEKNTEKCVIAETGIAGEKMILAEAENGMNVRARAECIYEALCKQWPKLNMVFSGMLSKTEPLSEQYSRLANTLRCLVVLGKPGLYADTESINRYSLAELNGEIDDFINKMQRYVHGRLFSAYQKELHQRMQRWQADGYPVIFVYRFILSLLTLLQKASGVVSLDVDTHLGAEKLLASCQTYDNLEQVLLDCYTRLGECTNEPGDNAQETAQRIVQYLHAHLYGSLTMQEIADEFSLSASYISRLMRIYYQESPMDYYNRLKIEEAKLLLTRQPPMRVKDVAEMLGFSDQQYFSKTFKKQTGISPMTLRDGEDEHL